MAGSPPESKRRWQRPEHLDPTRVKVVTERANVYLMGLVTRAEAEAAVQVTRSVPGVVRVIKVFEYI